MKDNPTTAPRVTSIFVYGSLRKGAPLHGYLDGQRFIGLGWTVNLYALAVQRRLPLLTEAPVSTVRGEVWDVDAACLAILDEIEGHPVWYRRSEVEIELEEGCRVVRAWTYFYVHPVCPYPSEAVIQVPDGDYLAFLDRT